MVLQVDKILVIHLTKLDDADFSSVSADGIAFPSPFSSVSFSSVPFFPNEVNGNCDSSLTYTSETQFVIHIYMNLSIIAIRYTTNQWFYTIYITCILEN